MVSQVLRGGVIEWDDVYNHHEIHRVLAGAMADRHPAKRRQVQQLMNFINDPLSLERLARGQIKPYPSRETPHPTGRMLMVPHLQEAALCGMLEGTLGAILGGAGVRPSAFSASVYGVPKGCNSVAPASGPLQLLDRVTAKLREWPGAWVWRGDVAKAFNTIRPNLALEALVRMLERVGWALHVGVRRYLEGLLYGSRVLSRAHREPDWPTGIPTGNPLSPLLLGVVLDPLDRALEAALPGGSLYARFADDLVVLAQDQASMQRLESTACSALANLGLTLGANKTATFPPGNPFPLMGFEVHGSRRQVPSAKVTDWAQRIAKAIGPDKTRREHTRMVRGWMAYHRSGLTRDEARDVDRMVSRHLGRRFTIHRREWDSQKGGNQTSSA